MITGICGNVNYVNGTDLLYWKYCECLSEYFIKFTKTILNKEIEQLDKTEFLLNWVKEWHLAQIIIKNMEELFYRFKLFIKSQNNKNCNTNQSCSS